MSIYRENGSIYHCLDDDFVCDLVDGVCSYCHYCPETSEFVE